MTNENIYQKFVFINEFLQKNKNQSGDITRGQGRVLSILKRKDGIPTKELSEILNINLSSTNELLLKLENKEYIVRERSSKDKRIILIKLTKKGFEYQLKSPESIWVFDCLDEDAQNKFDNYLDEIIDYIHDELKKKDPETFKKKASKRKELYEKYFGNEKSDSIWYEIINKY